MIPDAILFAEGVYYTVPARLRKRFKMGRNGATLTFGRNRSRWLRVLLAGFTSPTELRAYILVQVWTSAGDRVIPVATKSVAIDDDVLENFRDAFVDMMERALNPPDPYEATGSRRPDGRWGTFVSDMIGLGWTYGDFYGRVIGGDEIIL